MGSTFVDKPWGSEEILVLTEHYCAKRLRVDAGHRLSLQYHVVKDETMVLESGEAYLLLGDSLATLERLEMVPGVAIRIAPGQIHRLSAVTSTTVLEVSTSELDDVVRLDDDYSR